jgi:inorganic pyrophosphatase
MFLEALKDAKSRTENGDVNVFVETPKGSSHKYDLDNIGLFRIAIELPEGQRFPFSFGFVPNTMADDGDPLDIILLTAGAVPAGALIEARLIGVLKMENDEGGKMVRNDRVVAIANMSRIYKDIGALSHTRDGFSGDIELFFENYNRMIKRPFNLVGRGDKEEAYQMLKRSEQES